MIHSKTKNYKFVRFVIFDQHYCKALKQSAYDQYFDAKNTNGLTIEDLIIGLHDSWTVIVPSIVHNALSDTSP